MNSKTILQYLVSNHIMLYDIRRRDDAQCADCLRRSPPETFVVRLPDRCEQHCGRALPKAGPKAALCFAGLDGLESPFACGSEGPCKPWSVWKFG